MGGVGQLKGASCGEGSRGLGYRAVNVALQDERRGPPSSPLTVAFTALGPEPLAPKGLQYLVLLSHAHSRECSLVPGLRGPGGQDGGLVWECSAGHTFSWGPSSGPKSPEEPNLTPLPSTDERSWCPEARSGQEPAGRLGERRVMEKKRGELRTLLCNSEPHSSKMILSQWKNSMLIRKYILNIFLGMKSRIQNWMYRTLPLVDK